MSTNSSTGSVYLVRMDKLSFMYNYKVSFVACGIPVVPLARSAPLTRRAFAFGALALRCR